MEAAKGLFPFNGFFGGVSDMRERERMLRARLFIRNNSVLFHGCFSGGIAIKMQNLAFEADPLRLRLGQPHGPLPACHKCTICASLLHTACVGLVLTVCFSHCNGLVEISLYNDLPVRILDP